jgi:hypothetical protein
MVKLHRVRMAGSGLKNLHYCLSKRHAWHMEGMQHAMGCLDRILHVARTIGIAWTARGDVHETYHDARKGKMREAGRVKVHDLLLKDGLVILGRQN